MAFCDQESAELGACCSKGYGHDGEHRFDRPKQFLQIGNKKINVANPVGVWTELLTQNSQLSVAVRDAQLEVRELKREVRGLAAQNAELLNATRQLTQQLAQKALPAPERAPLTRRLLTWVKGD